MAVAPLRSHLWGPGGALAVALLLTACVHAPAPHGPQVAAAETSAPLVDTAVSQAITEVAHHYLASRSADAVAGRLSSGAMDLNDDGFLDAVVIEEACLTPTCRLLVLGGTDEGLVLISEGSLAGRRISASKHMTNGWRDLIVTSDNTPSARFLLLRFDGLGYAEDLTGSRALNATCPTVQEGTLLLEVKGTTSAMEARRRVSRGG